MISNETSPRPPMSSPRPAQSVILVAVAALAATVVVLCVMFAPTMETVGAIWPVLGLISLVFLVAGGALSAAVALRAARAASAPSAGGGRSRLALPAAALIVGVGLLGVLGMVMFRLFVPAPDQTVTVQFSDPTGRVVLEYCPTLPSSFEAQSRPADVAGTASVIPVRVTADICGNPAFDQGVWLYLQRAGVTIAVTAPDRP